MHVAADLRLSWGVSSSAAVDDPEVQIAATSLMGLFGCSSAPSGSWPTTPRNLTNCNKESEARCTVPRRSSTGDYAPDDLATRRHPLGPTSLTHDPAALLLTPRCWPASDQSGWNAAPSLSRLVELLSSRRYVTSVCLRGGAVGGLPTVAIVVGVVLGAVIGAVVEAVGAAAAGPMAPVGAAAVLATTLGPPD